MQEIMRIFGLNEYEAKAYTALLRAGPVTGYRLSKESGVPLGKIYDVLNSLAAKGFATVKPGKPKIFEANDPKTISDFILSRKEKELKGMKKEMLSFAKLFQYKISEPFSVSYGDEAHYSKMTAAAKAAKKEGLAIFDTASTRGHNFLLDLAKKQINRGVKTKFIIPYKKEEEKFIKQLRNAGVCLRHYPIHKMRLVVVDKQITIISIVDEGLPEGRVSVYVKSGGFAKAMNVLFESLWEKSGK